MDLRETINTKKKHSPVPKSVVTRVTRIADNDQDLRGSKAKKKSPKKDKRNKRGKRGLGKGEAALQGEVALRSRKRRRLDNDEDDNYQSEDEVAERKVRYVDNPDPEPERERAPSPASSSSLSLSPSPSPERRLSPPSPQPPPPSRNYRSRSPSSGRSRYSRSPPRPPVRRHSYFNEPRYDEDRRPPRRSSYEDSRYHYDASVSWESKVEQFMQGLQKRTPTPPNGDDRDVAALSKVDEKTETVAAGAGIKDDPKPPGVEEEDDEDAHGPEEDIKVTPLIRFVGKKLSDAADGGKKRKKKKGAITLRLEGVFQYSLVSLFSRAEWVAAKSIKLLEEAGYPESKMSFMATMRGGLALETDLKSAVFTGKVKLGNKPELVHQVLKVIEYLVKYFTAKDGDADSSDDGEDSEENQCGENGQQGVSGNAMRRGIGETLKQLAVEEDVKASREKKAAEEAEAALPKQPPINPWRLMEDAIQSEALRSLEGIKTHVAKTMLRLGDEKLCEAGRAFDVAQDMVSSLVVAGYSHPLLVQRVMKTPADDILPPKDEAENAAPDRKPVLYDEILQKLYQTRSQLPPDITDHQLQFIAKKSLVFVMRGCEKVPSTSGGGGSQQQLPPHKLPDGSNIVFNYLPPGLREMEARKGGVPRGANGQPAAEGYGTMDDSDKFGDAPAPTEELDPEVRDSTDPLNAILNPEMHEKDRNLLPAKKKYMFGTFHAEWVVMQGKPQVYSVSVYMSDLTSLDVYFVPEALKRNSELFSSLGFVANPDRNEYYFVQVGLGVIKALGVERGVDKLAHFLEEKRESSSSSENRNNGLVLACYAEEEMAIVARMLEEGGHKNVLLDSVKGLACLEHYFDRNRSKKFSYSGPKLNVGSDEAFYETEVRKGFSTSSLVSKNKAEALFLGTEFVLESLPTYRNFIGPYAFRAFGSPKAELAKKRLRQAEEMYPLEVFMAAQLKQQKVPLFAEGVFAPQLGKDVRDKCTVVASRMCRLLIEAGFDKGTLAKCFEKSREFTINSSVILDKMAMAQRLKVMDQTMRCIAILRAYFLGCR